MTLKQQRFVGKLLANPKMSATQAAAETYDIKGSRNTAEVIAYENLRKPQIMAVLAKHDLTAQKVLAEAMKATRKQYGFNPDTKAMELLGEEDDHTIRVRAADSVLDRLHGKATQKIDQQITSVTVGIDLSGATTDATG